MSNTYWQLIASIDDLKKSSEAGMPCPKYVIKDIEDGVEKLVAEEPRRGRGQPKTPPALLELVAMRTLLCKDGFIDDKTHTKTAATMLGITGEAVRAMVKKAGVKKDDPTFFHELRDQHYPASKTTEGKIDSSEEALSNAVEAFERTFKNVAEKYKSHCHKKQNKILKAGRPQK